MNGSYAAGRACAHIACPHNQCIQTLPRSGSGLGGVDGTPADGSGAPGESSASHTGIPGPIATSELAVVAALMVEHRLDSVEMPSGLKVRKRVHLAPVDPSPSPEVVEDAVKRRLESLGIVNATEDSGRMPVDEEAIMFAASRAPEITLDEFTVQTQAIEEQSNGND
jgi:hypothetical protein